MSEPASKQDVVVVTCVRFVRNLWGENLLQGPVLIDIVRTAQNQSPRQVYGKRGGGTTTRRGRERRKKIRSRRNNVFSRIEYVAT